MAEPTLVDSGSSDYSDLTTSGEVTKSFTWQNGDVFHILGATEDNAQTLGVPATGGANLTFSQITATNTASNVKCYYWRGTATGSGSGTITATAGGGTNSRGITVWQYRDTSGQGTPQTIVGSSAKTISVTRAQANSHILEVMGDWNEVGDTVTDPTPAGGTQLIELAVSGRVDYFVTQWGDQGATGTTAYGITNHTGTVKMTGIAVEIQGVAGGAITGTAGATFGQSGTLVGIGALTGSGALTFSQSGTLTGGSLSGTGSITFGQSATISATGALSASATITLGESATLAGIGALVSTDGLTFGQVATLNGVGSLTASATVSFGLSGTLAGVGALTGSGSITFDGSATAQLPAGAISGSAALSLDATATLLGVGALAGTGTIRFNATARTGVEDEDHYIEYAAQRRKRRPPIQKGPTALEIAALLMLM